MTQLNVVNQNTEPTLDELCAILVVEKAKLTQCQNNVRDAEEALLKAIGVKDEGSFTLTGDRYKATTTQNIRRTIDDKRAEELHGKLSPDLAQGLIQWKASISTRVFKEIQAHRPETFSIVADYVVSKPSKPTVKVEPLVAEGIA